MSRTDKTNPYYVKFFYEPGYLREEHRHEFHECNLPPKPTIKQVATEGLHWSKWDGPCHWWPSFEFHRSKDGRCPCYACGPDAFEKMPRRHRQRLDGRRYCQDGWRDEY